MSAFEPEVAKTMRILPVRVRISYQLTDRQLAAMLITKNLEPQNCDYFIHFLFFYTCLMWREHGYSCANRCYTCPYLSLVPFLPRDVLGVLLYVSLDGPVDTIVSRFDILFCWRSNANSFTTRRSTSICNSSSDGNSFWGGYIESSQHQFLFNSYASWMVFHYNNKTDT